MELDLLDVLLILAKRKRLILGWTLSGLLIVGVLVYFVVRPTFTGSAVIMPPEKEQTGAAALMSQFGALASMTGVSDKLNLKNPSDLYIGILKSQTIADDMIKRFDLMHVYNEKLLSQARKMLASNSKFTSGKDSLIDISVNDHDSHRAAALANGYVDELYKLNNHLAFTEATQRRIFFSGQLEQAKDKLADAEVALKKTEEATGVLSPRGQVETIIRQIMQVEAQIASREVELDAMRISSTEENPRVVQLTAELAGLRGQLKKLQDGAAKHVPGNISISAANAPQAALDYVRKERDVKYYQLLYDLLARQYEAARIDEAKSVPVIQVVDPARVPDRRSGPHRLLWTFAGGFLGFLIGSGTAFISNMYRTLRSDEVYAVRLSTLKDLLSFRRT